jgi:hypothetical protein
MPPLPIADFPAEILAIFIPITALMIPIVAILTTHQRRMAELYHSRNPQMDQHAAMQMEAMRREMAELKTLIHQQAIAIDNLAPRLTPPSVTDRMENTIR